MLITNIKETIRWALKQKVTTILIISGMSVGITVALLIGLWGMNEFSFDKFHNNYDRIYRVCRNVTMNNEMLTIGADFKPLGEEAKEKFPQIEEFCRVKTFERSTVKVANKTISQGGIVFSDLNYFQFFSYKIKKGNPETCLDAPNKIIIDEDTATEYFESQDPVGQIIEVLGKKLQVSAVMENMPDNSHQKFHLIIPFTAVSFIKNDGWGSSDNYITYLLLKGGSDPATLAKDITAMTYEKMPIYEKLNVTHFLQPLTEIHFSSGFRFDFVISGDKRIVFIFISLAILILLIASFNFVNLFISTSFLRAKSIGVKKINGSSKANLFLSSYFETGLYILASTVIATILTIVLLPMFNQLADTNLTLNLTDYHFYLFVGILFLVTMLMAGTFPVVYMLRFNPAEIIRNRIKGSGITLLQRTLIISQFAASILLICSAGIIKKQIEYVKNKDLGFNKDHVAYVLSYPMVQKYDAVREELLRNPNVLDITGKNSLPTDWNSGNDVSLADNSSVSKLMEICSVKENYFDMMQMPIVEGRNPFEAGKENSAYCVVNEKAAQSLGLKKPLGKQIKVFDKTYTIEGVVKDANTKSLHSTVDPQVYTYLSYMGGICPIMIKTNNNPESVIASLQEIWTKYNPETPFEYHFLDQLYDKLYKTESRASKIVLIGMIIAFFLAFMGLYAVAHYATERRVKEIGVRKVNGARISEILVLLNRSFVSWVLSSVIIATPITWLLLNKWLENFAYRTTLSWWIFALAGVIALGVALLTVSWKSWQAATRNPVEALRYE